jgi:hypothetical protein
MEGPNTTQPLRTCQRVARPTPPCEYGFPKLRCSPPVPLLYSARLVLQERSRIQEDFDPCISV